MWHRSLPKEVKTWRMLNVNIFTLGLKKGMIRQRVWGISVVTRGTLSTACLFRLLLCPLSSEIRMRAFPLGTGRAPLTGKHYDPLQGKVRKSFRTCCFSNSFSLKHSVCQGAVFWGSRVEPHQHAVSAELYFSSLSGTAYMAAALACSSAIPSELVLKPHNFPFQLSLSTSPFNKILPLTLPFTTFLSCS